MKACVTHFSKCGGSTTLSSSTLSPYLSKLIGCPLADSKESLEAVGECDTVFAVNSMWNYCDFREEMKAFIQGKKLILIANDWHLTWSPEFKKAYHQVWTNCENVMAWRDSKYLCWNQFSFRPVPHVGGLGFVYFGAFREDRVGLFKKYLPPLGNKVTIACSTKARGKFGALAWRAKLMEPIPAEYLNENLARFDSTLYLQDVSSNTTYHSPATRFYESLSAGVALFFDEAAIFTFDKTGMDIRPWVVQGPQDILDRLSEAEFIAKEQARVLKRDFRSGLDKVILGLVDRL